MKIFVIEPQKMALLHGWAQSWRKLPPLERAEMRAACFKKYDIMPSIIEIGPAQNAKEEFLDWLHHGKVNNG